MDNLSDIRSRIDDVFQLGFEFSNTKTVPSVTDSGLSFEQGLAKRGKIISTCVLFVDIRNSVTFTDEHQTKTNAKIYTSFISSVLRIAQMHNGFVRNIIGDRVMVVFPEEDCFINAFECATDICEISGYIQRKLSTGTFKCGIGIHYGKMYVIKTGIPRRSCEQEENRSLVWIGDTANLASRLTDVAGKTIENVIFEVEDNSIFDLAYKSTNPLFNSFHPNRSSLSKDEFIRKLEFRYGKIYLKDFRPTASISKKEHNYKFPRILVSEDVYRGIRSRNKTYSLTFREVNEDIRDICFRVYGRE